MSWVFSLHDLGPAEGLEVRGVLLEAPSVSVAGGLFANGGGGGCGGFSCGEPATMSTTPAPGDDICDQATGGNGAAGDLQATVGGNVTGTAGATDRAGGGGGGFGRIRVNSLDGAIEGTPVLSPDASVGQVAGR